MRVKLRYGRQGLEVELPDGNVRHVLRLNRLPKIADPRAVAVEALQDPIGVAPLAQIARGRRDAVIVVSDITRPVPNRLILPPILDSLQAAGIAPTDTLILVATGLHRENTPTELAEMLGEEVLARGVRVENHIARDRDAHVYLGETDCGIPAWVDRRYVEADLKITTALVEPHLMAGYSGGRKAICPGLCAVETVMHWHGPHMLAPDEARAGNLVANPVHEQALQIADLAGGADFIVNVTMDEERDVTGVFAGDMRAAHEAAIARAERQARVTIPEPVDIVVTTAAGYPLDLTFYQGIKGMIAAVPIVKPGGTIIIAQENAEGIGGDEFRELMLSIPSPAENIAEAMRGEVASVDQWQLQEFEKVLRVAEVWNYSDRMPRELQERLFVRPLASVEAGVTEALRRYGADAQIAVIPEGPYVLCEVA
jgi:lactate racemase